MQCEYTRPDGERCRAQAQGGGRLCFAHDPARSAQRAAARQAGGRARSRPARTLPEDAPDLPLATVADVVAALAGTFNAVRTGRLDCRIGNCLGVLAGHLLTALKLGPLEERLAAVEARLAQQATGGRP